MAEAGAALGESVFDYYVCSPTDDYYSPSASAVPGIDYFSLAHVPDYQSPCCPDVVFGGPTLSNLPSHPFQRHHQQTLLGEVNDFSAMDTSFIPSGPQFRISSDFNMAMRPELSVLSAEMYDDSNAFAHAGPRRNGPAPAHADRQVFGGFLLKPDESSKSAAVGEAAEAAEAAPAKNRSRRRSNKSGTGSPGESEEDAASRKQRGRPRLDARDETAAERRRTQIRLAQRAYRLRKETTITSLKKRVGELETTIDKMNTAYLKFNDEVLTSGLLQHNANLAQGLRHTTELFLELARVASAHESENEDGVADNADEGKKRSADDADSDAGAHADADLSQPTKKRRRGSGPNPELISSQQSLQRQDAAADHSTSDKFAHRQGASSRETQEVEAEIYGSAARSRHVPKSQALRQYRAEVPSMDKYADTFSSTLGIQPSPPLFTFSFQETTFSRRLKRACLERGYHLLLNPDSNPREIKRVFQLTLVHNTREQLLRRIRELLVKSNKEYFEFAPALFNIGGAGKHYPRIEPPKSDDPGLKWSGGEPTGPIPLNKQPLVIKELPSDIINSGEFAGDWFDANDVEGYLKEKGVAIDASASFVEFEMYDSPASSTYANSAAAQSPLSSSSLVSHSSPTTPQTDNSAHPFVYSAESYFSGVGASANSSSSDLFDLSSNLTAACASTAPLANQFSSLDNNNTSPSAIAAPTGMESFFGPITDFDLYSQSSGLSSSFTPFASQPQPQPQPTKRVVSLDVDLLVDSILSKAVCLGQSPGFRRRDVDAALQAAMQVY